MRNIIAGFLVVLIFPFSAPAFGQTAEPVPFEMRQDEAFWNAIRDSSDPEAFKLFVQSHPESPYIPQANAKITELTQQPAAEAAAAPTSDEQAAPATPPVDPTAVPTQEQVQAALNDLGIRSGAPDPLTFNDDVRGYWRLVTWRNSYDDITDDELREIIYFAENRDAIYMGGIYDNSILNPLYFRLNMVYESVFRDPIPSATPELVTALQWYFDLPTTGLLDKAFLTRLLSEPVTYLYEPSTSDQVFGDWVFSDFDHEGLPRSCYLSPRIDKVRWDGPLLSTSLQNIDEDAGPLARYEEEDASGSGSSFDFTLAPDDMFSSTAPVKMVVGTKELPLFQEIDRWGNVTDWTEKLNSDGTSPGVAIKMLKAAVGEVRIEGMSKFGEPLTLFFSANGFTKAFQTMSRTCAGGKLDSWLN